MSDRRVRKEIPRTSLVAIGTALMCGRVTDRGMVSPIPKNCTGAEMPWD